MPQQVTAIRSELDDKEWATKAVVDLNSQVKTPIEVYGVSFTTSHSSRGPSIDIRDLQHPRIGAPGLITWQLNDWMKFPQSASDLSWPDTWFVSFDERNDGWYYRVTHDDLRKKNMTLQEFLTPMNQRLLSEPEFRQILQKSKETRALMEDVKAQIADRVVHPRHVWDLVEF
jgi:hypothetical protein